jgi:hypothetical protein
MSSSRLQPNPVSGIWPRAGREFLADEDPLARQPGGIVQVPTVAGRDNTAIKQSNLMLLASLRIQARGKKRTGTSR